MTIIHHIADTITVIIYNIMGNTIDIKMGRSPLVGPGKPIRAGIDSMSDHLHDARGL